jgi:hypothetical protein
MLAGRGGEVMSVEFSWRYAVVGVYKDRLTTRRNKLSVWRIYPVLFVRITITRSTVDR